MVNSLSIKEFSSTLFSRPYWKVNALLEELNISNETFNESFDILVKKFNELGIVLEIIELNKIEYIVPIVEIEKSNLSDTQLGLLILFGLKAKYEGGLISSNNRDVFFTTYYREMEFLVENKYILQREDSDLELTPIGALTIIPFLEDVEPLINKLVQF